MDIKRGMGARVPTCRSEKGRWLSSRRDWGGAATVRHSFCEMIRRDRMQSSEPGQHISHLPLAIG